MKKTVIILASLMISALVGAQGIDFSGNWKLNSSKSKLNAEFSMAPKSINIARDGNTLSVVKHSEFQGQEMVSTDKLTLDGKECTNPGFMDSEKKSTAVWADDKKSLKVVSKIAMGDGNEMVITEIYKLDGGSLVIDSSSSSSFGDMAETMVYDK
ncbi:MAG: hypothetical protein R6X09_10335 [Bacteroidales bacterium]